MAPKSDELAVITNTHRDSLERLRATLQQEARLTGETQPCVQLLQQMADNLRTAVHGLTRTESTIRDAFEEEHVRLSRREDVLRQADEKMQHQQEELEKFKRQVCTTLVKLEVHLKEQSKLAAEDRALVKQEQLRLSREQVTLEEERRSLVDQAGRERAELQQTVIL
ncbi:unnamed protein product [Protopolystoma xenopodis]|uniref:Fas-binding factor 1 C-terminal domain-containing protein n=1 Tax=Protopolystoma xenopodis TaxID=117903 RepID=A0A3S5CTQ9_9PLAT|nr:unnamed protein product [Protopolystoma xenopodis]